MLFGPAIQIRWFVGGKPQKEQTGKSNIVFGDSTAFLTVFWGTGFVFLGFSPSFINFNDTKPGNTRQVPENKASWTLKKGLKFNGKDYHLVPLYGKTGILRAVGRACRKPRFPYFPPPRFQAIPCLLRCQSWVNAPHGAKVGLKILKTVKCFAGRIFRPRGISKKLLFLIHFFNNTCYY